MAQHELPDISAHPLNNMNTEAIETAAAAIEALGACVGENGTQAVSAWAPISSAYKGPGDAELIAVMVPVGSMATSVKDRTASAARSLRTFKDTADEIKATMATLKSDLAIHTYNVNNYEPPQPATTGTTSTGIYGTTTTTGSYNGSWNAYGAAAVSTDWRDDSALVAENERIIKALNDAVERMHEAERQCASELRGLHGLTALTAGDGGYENGQYGVDSIPHDAATPWGTANPDDENCAEAAGSWVVGAGQDLVGLVGMRWDEDGNFSWTWDNFAETWTGMASLITYNPESGQWFDWGHTGETWLSVGQDFIAYDRWGENPEGAATDVVLNVVSSIGVVGLVSKIGKVGKAGRAGRVDADVDVDLDAADFDVPVIRFDTDIDLDFGDLDLDLDLPDGRPDVPNGRPDVPATAIGDATGGPDGPASQGTVADRIGGGDSSTGTATDGPPTRVVRSGEAPAPYTSADVQRALDDAPTNEFGQPIDHRDGHPLRLENAAGQRGWVMRWDPDGDTWVAENPGRGAPEGHTWIASPDPWVPTGRPGGIDAEPSNPTGLSYQEAATQNPTVTRASFGESQAQAFLEARGYARVDDAGKHPNAPGIDMILQHIDGHTLIVEAKYNTSRLGVLADGTPQMSEAWLTDAFGSAAGRTRIHAALPNDRAMLVEVLDAFDAREVTTIVAQVAADGTVTPRLVDSNGSIVRGVGGVAL
ncbi:hypothetical protein [Microbacterium arborescens]|uniref:hypothetical protein n=1 Tax=Microbacterium arborescens TaxID=33883 RepID=UPI00278A2701|nr:hypothetical protein [Microbacterium arborescens]MDQ1215383.1 hypothetical protein [Microbacterium arborescens]